MPRAFRSPGRRVAALLAAIVSLTASARAADTDAREYGKKAERIYNLARFVDWPARRFEQPDSPFVIGVIGSEAISGHLREALQDRQIKGRPVVVRHMTLKEELPSCHLLFVVRSEKDRLDSVLRAVRQEGILSVGESENFLGHGGVMSLLTVAGALRLQVSSDAVSREKLVVSSKLMQLALPPNFEIARRAPEAER